VRRFDPEKNSSEPPYLYFSVKAMRRKYLYTWFTSPFSVGEAEDFSYERDEV